jgi:hypothetical protein
VVGGADVDVWERVGAVQKFSGSAKVWDGLPDEEWFWTAGAEGLPPSKNRGYEIDASGWGAD